MPITQEQFDTVLFGIRKQGGPSKDDSGTCRFRGVNGRKCALGHLISDDNYRPSYEPCSVSYLVSAGVLPDIGAADAGAIQSIHDTSAIYDETFFGRWEEGMAAFATEHGLTYTAPEAQS